MKWEQLRPRLVLGATVLALIAVGVGRYQYVTQLPGVRALAHAAPERMLYYRVDAAHEPAFSLSGAQRAFRLVTHQIVASSTGDASYDPAQSYPYALELTVLDPQGRQLWQTTLREDSRQTRALGKDGHWTDETAYLEGRAHPVTDPRTSIVELPMQVPMGSTLVVAPASQSGTELLLRAYALETSGRQELRSKLARNPDLKLEGLSYLRAKELMSAQELAEVSDPPERMIAQDNSKGQAEVVPIFVRKARRRSPRTRFIPRRWVAGPWERSLMAKGPGTLEAELLYEKADAATPCPEGELIVEQLDFENQRQNRRYDLALHSQGAAHPRRCLSGRVEFELGLDLRDIRLRWKPRPGTLSQARMTVRLWAKDSSISVLSRQGWSIIEPFQELQEVPTLRLETELLGQSKDQVLRYDVAPGAGANRELDLSIRKIAEVGASSTEFAPGELSWRFLDAKGKKVGSGTLSLTAPFDPASWGHKKGQHASQDAQILPLMLSLPDRERIKVPSRAKVFEIFASVPSLAKVSARLRSSTKPAALDPIFAQIPLGKMKWALAPRVSRNWSMLRAHGLSVKDLVEVESQLHLQLRQPRDKKDALAIWKTLEPRGRSTRQEVLEQTLRPMPRCASCWYELLAGTEYTVHSSASLRRGAKVLMDMGTPATSAQLAGCKLEIDGKASAYRCPILRSTQSMSELTAGKHSLRWSKGPKNARLWVNQPSVAGKSAVQSYKRRTLHETGADQALELAWKKAKGQASRLHVDVYVPQRSPQASSAILEAQVQRGQGPWTRRESSGPQTIRGKRIKSATQLRFLNDTHSGAFSVYRFVIDVDANRQAGTYELAFSPVSQGKLWIRAINRM